jgi:hypothetical protein
MTNRETMQQALEALQYGKPNKAITILREALEREHAMHELARLGQEIEQEQQAEPCVGKDPRCPCQDGDACHYKDCGDTKALPVPVAQPEPTQWRDMIVATLVREGINKHRARELADHFAAQRPWQGLTDKDWEYVKDSKGTSLDTFDQGAAWAANQLRRRNA